jgi:hypothetical protein
MGLNVYLYEYDDYAATKAAEEEYERESERLWDATGKPYDDLTDTEKDEVRGKTNELARSLGLSECGSDDTRSRKIEIPSAKHPEHYFKIGYFWSSYNDSGCNRIFDNACGKNLYWVFEPNDQYCFQPNWQACRERAAKLLGEFKAYVAATPYRALEVSPALYRDHAVGSAEEAIAAFVEQRKQAASFGWYSTAKGYFFQKEPMRAVGLIHGYRDGFMKGPCVYVIYEDAELDWYVHALEIVIETCDWVLKHPNPEKLYLHWSS